MGTINCTISCFMEVLHLTIYKWHHNRVFRLRITRLLLLFKSVWIKHPCNYYIKYIFLFCVALYFHAKTKYCCCKNIYQTVLSAYTFHPKVYIIFVILCCIIFFIQNIVVVSIRLFVCKDTIHPIINTF